MVKQHEFKLASIERAANTFDETNCYLCDSEIFNIDVPSTKKLTFIALSRYFTRGGSKMPTNEQLASDVGCSEKRIAVALQRLSKHIVFLPHLVVFKQQQ